MPSGIKSEKHMRALEESQPKSPIKFGPKPNRRKGEKSKAHLHMLKKSQPQTQWAIVRKSLTREKKLLRELNQHANKTQGKTIDLTSSDSITLAGYNPELDKELRELHFPSLAQSPVLQRSKSAESAWSRPLQQTLQAWDRLEPLFWSEWDCLEPLFNDMPLFNGFKGARAYTHVAWERLAPLFDDVEMPERLWRLEPLFADIELNEPAPEPPAAPVSPKRRPVPPGPKMTFAQTELLALLQQLPPAVIKAALQLEVPPPKVQKTARLRPAKCMPRQLANHNMRAMGRIHQPRGVH